ncbi:hypothetical protein KP79_PYT04921 [Mizuhopecten yessoensis]|uniref:Uncharacterized protein n=1 Tax=Mizuhopecten yessoensis TaxID=6573 RepID=A0A210QIW2_MIZYE|nr:hypothetical protein KP79_PYT04921 [Mizuhopecten yessoensis]
MRDKLQDQLTDAHVRDQFSHSVDLLFFDKRHLVDRHKCVPSFHTAQQRMWRAFQLRGLISLETKYPIKRSESDDISKDQLLQVLFNSLKDRVPRVHKKDAMFEAYASVDFVDLHKLRDVLRSNCDLFDYDFSPSSIFNQSIPRKPPYRFFNFE